jgi:hypothetical protein
LQHVPALTTRVRRGEWPTAIDHLPLIITEAQLAHVLGEHVRTLQRRRSRSPGEWIRFKRVGRQVLYARQDVLQFVGGSKAA